MLLCFLIPWWSNRSIEWPQDVFLVILFPVYFGVYYSGRKKTVLPLLEFLNSDSIYFNYKGTDKVEERLSCEKGDIDFELLQEAFSHTSLSIVYANKEKFIIKLKEDLHPFKSSKAITVFQFEDELVLSCYSFVGNSTKKNELFCKDLIALLEVLKK